MKERIKEILKRIHSMPMMHGDYQLDPILAQDLIILLRDIYKEVQH